MSATSEHRPDGETEPADQQRENGEGEKAEGQEQQVEDVAVMKDEAKYKEEVFRKIFQLVATYIDRHLLVESLSKELGLTPDDQEVLRVSCIGQKMTDLVEKTLWAWHDRDEKGASADRLVRALRRMRLHRAADSVEEYCLKVHKPQRKKPKSILIVNEEGDQACAVNGQEKSPGNETDRSEAELREVTTNMTYRSPGRHKRHRGGNLFIRFFVAMKPRQETKHTPLAKEGVQPLVRAYHDYIIRERQHYMFRLTKAIDIKGVEVLDYVDRDICIFIHVFVRHSQELRRLREYYETDVLRDRCQEALLDQSTLEETRLHNLPMDSWIEVTDESFSACHDEIRLTRIVKQYVEKKTEVEREPEPIVEQEAKEVLPPAHHFDHTVVFIVDKKPELIDIAVVPGIENGLILLDKDVPRVLVCKCWRDQYSPKKKILRTIRSFTGEGKYKMRTPVAVASWEQWIVVADKLRECLLFFTLEGEGVHIHKLQKQPLDIEMRQNRLWLAFEGRVEGNRLIGSPENDDFKWELFRYSDVPYLYPVHLNVNERGDVFVVSQTNVGERYLYMMDANLIKRLQAPAKYDAAGLWATACDDDDSVIAITNTALERVKLIESPRRFDMDDVKQLFPEKPEGDEDEVEKELYRQRLLDLTMSLIKLDKTSRETAIGIILAALSSLFFAAGLTSVRLCSDFSMFEIVVGRSLFAALIATIYLTIKKEPILELKNKYVWTVGLLYGTIVLCYHLALLGLTLSDCSAIYFSQPFLVGIFGYLILMEKVGCTDVLIMVTAFVGVLLIAQPAFLKRLFNVEDPCFSLSSVNANFSQEPDLNLIVANYDVLPTQNNRTMTVKGAVRGTTNCTKPSTTSLFGCHGVKTAFSGKASTSLEGVARESENVSTATTDNAETAQTDMDNMANALTSKQLQRQNSVRLAYGNKTSNVTRCGEDSLQPGKHLKIPHVTGCVLAFTAAIGSALMYVVQRKVSEDVSAMTMLNQTGLVSGLLAVIPTSVIGRWSFPPRAEPWLFLLPTAVFSALAQIFCITALKYESALMVSMVRTSEIPHSLIMQVIIVHRIPNTLDLVGATVVLISVLAYGGKRMCQQKSGKGKDPEMEPMLGENDKSNFSER